MKSRLVCVFILGWSEWLHESVPHLVKKSSGWKPLALWWKARMKAISGMKHSALFHLQNHQHEMMMRKIIRDVSSPRELLGDALTDISDFLVRSILMNIITLKWKSISFIHLRIISEWRACLRTDDEKWHTISFFLQKTHDWLLQRKVWKLLVRLI